MFAKRYFPVLSLTAFLLLGFLLAGCQSQVNVTTTAPATVIQSAGICAEDLNTSGHEYIQNGQFRSGMTGWQTVDEPGSQGSDFVSIGNDRTCGTVVRLKRQSSDSVSGLVGLQQAVNVNSSGLKNLEVQLVAKIDDQNLQSDGNIGGETPVFITLDYVTKTGQHKSWTHGLMLTNHVNYPGRDQSIAAVYWTTYKSGNLLKMLPDLSTIQNVTIGGNGQDFYSSIAFVSLLGS
ncbi:MAG: hypothetical protein M1309_06990 [Actinobacteria bacterium]|nr:hypothetical protein [Actinomycetota bacterium]